MTKLEVHVLETVMAGTVGPRHVKLSDFEGNFIASLSTAYEDRELTPKQIDTLISIHDKVTGEFLCRR